jgi:hypothetical protein
MSTLTTTLSPTDAGRAEILARHLLVEERTAENADLKSPWDEEDIPFLSKVARELGCGEDEAHFEGNLKQVAGVIPVAVASQASHRSR